MRNTLKRRVRELIRKHGDPLACGLHVVCVLRWRATTAPFSYMEKDWLKTTQYLLRELTKMKESVSKDQGGEPA